MWNKIKGKSPIVLLLNIVTIVLCAACLLAVVGVVVEVRNINSYYADEDFLIYRLQEENYAELWRMSYEDTRKAEDKQDYYAIGEYLEAAFLQRAFERTGDDSRAGQYRARMESAAANVREFKSVIAKLDAVLEKY